MLNGAKPRLYDHCTVCGAEIRWGDKLISVSRTEERLRGDGDIDVDSGELLASLCSSCGCRFPAATIHVTFGARVGAFAHS